MRKKQCSSCRRPKIVRRRTGFCKFKPPVSIYFFENFIFNPLPLSLLISLLIFGVMYLFVFVFLKGWLKVFGGAVMATVGLAAAIVDKFKERDQPSIHESIIGLQKGQERMEKILSTLDGGNGGNGGSAAS